MAVYNLFVSFAAALAFLLFGSYFGELSFGKENIIGGELPLLLSIELFLLSSRTTLIVFRDAMGDYHRDRWKPILEAVMVIALNLILSGTLSFLSIPVAVSITLILVSIPVDSYIVIHRLNDKSSSAFFRFYLSTLLILAVLIAIGILVL